MSRTVLLLMVLFILVIPVLASASGCFLYPESSYYCKDISEGLASEECDLQGCDMRLFFKSTSCANLPLQETCSKVLCKSTCSVMSARDCTAGAVPVGQESVWCGKGCCKYGSGSDQACFAASSRHFCEMNAKTAGVSQYSFLITNISCTLECNRGLSGAEVGTISLNGTVSHGVSEKLDTKNRDNSDSFGMGSSILVAAFIIMLLVGIVVFVILRSKQKLSSSKLASNQKADDVTSGDEHSNVIDSGLSRNRNAFSGLFFDSRVDRTTPRSTQHLSRKSHQASRLHAFEEFSHHGGSKKATFDKLGTIALAKKTALEKLERFGSGSAFNPVKNSKEENLKKVSGSIKKEKGALEELRKMATSRK